MLLSSSDFYRNTDASILVYNHRPERTGFNMYVENTQQQLTFLALLPCVQVTFTAKPHMKINKNITNLFLSR